MTAALAETPVNVSPISLHQYDPYPSGALGAVELRDRTGATYRQIDYWTRTRRLHVLTKPCPGIGHLKAYPTTEVPVARLVKRLLDAGLTLDAAFACARDLTTTGTTRIAGMTVHLPIQP